MQQQALHNDYLLLLSDAIRPLANPLAIQYEAVCVLGKYLGANRAGYAETQQNVELVAVTRNYTFEASDLIGVYHYRDYGPELLQRLKEGQTVIREDIANDPSLTESEKEAHRILGLGATINVPLVKDGHLVAILFVHFKDAHHFSAEEIALAEETAERTWAAVARAQAEAAMRNSEQELSVIVNQAMTGIARGDNHGTLTFVNQRYCQMLGYEADELIGKSMQELTHPDDRERNLRMYFNLVQTGQPFEIEKRYIRKDGSLLWVHNSVSALRDHDGNVTQLLAVSTDISARKSAEAALVESEKAYKELAAQLEARVEERTMQLASSVAGLKRSNDSLQQFAYVASHDLQEPLRKILQFGGRLRDTYPDTQSEGVFYLERMLASASRMSKLIHDLLDFSRITAEMGEKDRVPLDLLMKDVLTMLEFAVKDKRATIQLDPLPVVSGNALQLTQLFQNLISNALKFQRPDVAPVVEIKADLLEARQLPDWAAHVEVTPAYHRIDVRDNGIGFDEQYLDRIFKMFQRLNGKSEFEGTGIGLAICEKVVANHGGAIYASSQPGEGATFTILLPA